MEKLVEIKITVSVEDGISDKYEVEDMDNPKFDDLCDTIVASMGISAIGIKHNIENAIGETVTVEVNS